MAKKAKKAKKAKSAVKTVSYTHLDVYKRQVQGLTTALGSKVGPYSK